MGYITTFSLEIVDVPELGTYANHEIAESLIEKRVVEKLEGWNPFEDSCKWYDWESDLREISETLIGCCFKVHGEGEENGDIWDAYFFNGNCKVYKAQIMIPPFNYKDLH